MDQLDIICIYMKCNYVGQLKETDQLEGTSKVSGHKVAIRLIFRQSSLIFCPSLADCLVVLSETSDGKQSSLLNCMEYLHLICIPINSIEKILGYVQHI